MLPCNNYTVLFNMLVQFLIRIRYYMDSYRSFSVKIFNMTLNIFLRLISFYYEIKGDLKSLPNKRREFNVIFQNA